MLSDSIGGTAEVERARLALLRDAERVGEPLRDPVCGRSHGPCPGDDGELDALPAGDAVHDLVDGSVAAECHEQLGALVGRLPREVSELARALGEDRLTAQAGRVRGAASSGQRRPVLPFADAGLTRRTVFSAFRM